MNVQQEPLPPLVIRASAGAGKTYALSLRYIKLLALGEQPERILATTFTRKAAGEIRARVFQRLVHAAQEKEAAALLADQLEVPSFQSADALRLLRLLVEHQHRLQINTLDSFCVRVALNFSYELGLPPGWKILDEYRDRGLRQQAIQFICRDAKPGELSELLQLLGKGDVARTVHDRLARLLLSLDELCRESEVAAWTWLEPPPEIPENEFTAILQQLEQVPLPAGKKGPDQRWLTARERDLELLQKAQWKEALQKGITKAVREGSESYYRRPIPDEVQALYQKVLQQCASKLLRELRNETLVTRELAERFVEAYQKLKDQKGGRRFNDLKIELAQSALSGDLEELYFRLDSRIAHVLLDEFQDTSRHEWNVLDPLVHEILSKSGEEHSFFCVGDAKQAIYAWRGGVAEIFDSLENRWPQLSTQTLEKSYRSAPEVIDCVNQVFSQLQAGGVLANYDSVAAEWCQRFLPHSTAREDYAGYVLLKESAAADSLAEKRHRLYRQLAIDVQDLVQAASTVSIGILVRRNKDVGHLMYYLNDIGIRASEEGGTPLTDSNAVLVLLALIRLCDHPGDSIASYLVAHSPMCQLYPELAGGSRKGLQNVTSQVRRSLEQNGLGKTVFQWTKVFENGCSSRDWRRLLQLVELAYAFEQESYSRVSEFDTVVRQKKVEDPFSAQVRVMTVHQAKGLEFDAVFLPELEQHFLKAPAEGMLVSQKDPLQAPDRVIRSAAKEICDLDVNLKSMWEQTRAQRLKEELSVFYVALTRAKYALHMYVMPGKRSGVVLSAAGILRRTLAAESKNEILYESGSDEWFTQLEREQPTVSSEVSSERPERIDFSETSKRLPRLQRKTPTMLEGSEQVNVERLLSPIGETAARRGTVLHAFFETVLWANEPDEVCSTDTLQGIARRYGASQKESEKWVNEFREITTCEEMKELLQRSRYQERKAEIFVEREFPFAFRQGESLLYGVIDRLVYGMLEGKVIFAEIIDFKTDAVRASDPQALNEKIEFYRPQLEAYKNAMSKFFRIEDTAIEAVLAFVSVGEIVKV